VAKTAVVLIWIFTTIDFFNDLASSGIKYILCFVPNYGFMFALQPILQFERSSKTLNFTTLYTNLYGDSVRLGFVLLAQMFWTLCYIPLTWYIEKIFPGEYGAPLPFYFPFLVR
jgi:hypothetical protein